MNREVKRIYIDIVADSFSGWGNYMRSLIKFSAMRGIKVISVGAFEFIPENIPYFDRPLIEEFMQDSTVLKKRISQGEIIHDPEGIMFTHMGWNADEPRFMHPQLKLKTSIGATFFESLYMIREVIEVFKTGIDHIICGSSWNYNYLKQLGYKGGVLILQGTDTNHFHPRIAPLQNDGNFYIFSGGKLELRKGQDIVLNSFSKIVKEIPQAKLVTCWGWDNDTITANRMNKMGYLKTPWQFYTNHKGEEKVDIKATAKSYGIDPNSIMELTPRPAHMLAPILNQVHCAIFPNRAEGGTNLVAMEAIASGIPTLLSQNSGHLDLINICPSLKTLAFDRNMIISIPDQRTQDQFNHEFEGWKWPNPINVAEKVIELYQNYDYHAGQAKKAALQISEFSWENQINQLLDFIITGKVPSYQPIPTPLG